jgi:hypothetical protein
MKKSIVITLESEEGNWCMHMTLLPEKYGTDLELSIFPATSNGPIIDTTIYLPVVSRKELLKFANDIIVGCN